jgi:hypothetical protein
MGDDLGSRYEREEVIERDDAVRLGRRYGETTADVVKGTRRDPPESRLHRVKGGQEEIAV